MSREFACKPLNSLGLKTTDRDKLAPEFEKFPVLFPVSREFASGDGFDTTASATIYLTDYSRHNLQLKRSRWRVASCRKRIGSKGIYLVNYVSLAGSRLQ